MALEPVRWSIPGLIARYDLEPTIRDIFVEGEFDRLIIDWFLKSVHATNVSVYEIGLVDVPKELVEAVGVSGNRGRVIGLANELDRHFAKWQGNVLCLVDRDLDMVFGKIASYDHLIFTDYCNFNMYWLNDSVLSKYFRLCCRREISDGVGEYLGKLLVEIFLIRCSKAKLFPKMKWITFSRCCSIESDHIEFDRDTFVRRLLEAFGRPKEQAKFLRQVESFRLTLSEDYRQSINGHDLIELLGWYQRKLGIRGPLCSELVIERSLAGCIEVAQLLNYPLFKRLFEWDGVYV